MAKFSTGLRNTMLGSQSFRDALNGGELRIYAGTAPATADAAVGASTLLVALTVDGLGGGLNFAAAAENGAISKSSSEVWKGTVAATGNAAWFRYVAAGDTGASSGTALRVQGTIGAAGADMLVANQLLTETEEFILNYFVVALPTL